MWCCYMLRYIAAQPFRGVLFSVCSSRAVLTKQIITQSCLVMLGWVSVLHNHAEVSVVLFILLGVLGMVVQLKGRYLHISARAVGGLSHSFRWEILCWLGRDGPAAGNSGLNSWLVDKAARRTC